MNKKQIAKLRSELKAKRASPHGIKSSDLITIASKLGRVKCNRGKEPTYVRESDPSLSPPLSIPKHAADLKPGTAKSIIDQLLSDLDDWELFLNEEEEELDHDDGGDDE